MGARQAEHGHNKRVTDCFWIDDCILKDRKTNQLVRELYVVDHPQIILIYIQFIHPLKKMKHASIGLGNRTGIIYITPYMRGANSSGRSCLSFTSVSTPRSTNDFAGVNRKIFYRMEGHFSWIVGSWQVNIILILHTLDSIVFEHRYWHGAGHEQIESFYRLPCCQQLTWLYKKK